LHKLTVNPEVFRMLFQEYNHMDGRD